MTPFELDLENSNGRGKLEWTSAESEAEHAARLAREARESVHDLRVRWWTFIAGLFALFVVGATGLALIFAGGTPERERVGIVFLTAIVSGAIGFVTGRSGKPGR